MSEPRKTCFNCAHMLHLAENRCPHCEQCYAVNFAGRPGWEDRQGQSMPQPYHPPVKGAAA